MTAHRHVTTICSSGPDGLFCAATGLDGPGAVAVRGDRIVAAGPDVAGTARNPRVPPLLLPGLVDLHTHPGPATGSTALTPTKTCWRVARPPCSRRATPVQSRGRSMGAEIIAPAQTRIRLAINLARLGESRPGPCFQRADDVDVDACVAR